MPSLKDLRFWKKSTSEQDKQISPQHQQPSNHAGHSHTPLTTDGPDRTVPVPGQSILPTSSTTTTIPTGQYPAPAVIGKGKNHGITILHIPDGADDHLDFNPVVDIVFLHGLTGNSYDTWWHRESGVHWPRDLLKHDIPHGRLLSWGYDADVASFWGHASSNRLTEHARNLVGDLVWLRMESASEQRPILFVAHSLGGLVIQRALSISRERAESHLNSLEANARGIAFLGTPHNGSDLAAWAVLGARLIAKFKDTNVSILRTLERDSEILRDTQDAFGQLLRAREREGRPINVTCFYEEHALTGVGMVVPQSSASLFGYDYYGIPNNHKDMPKFANRSEVGYGRVAGELKRWARSCNEDTFMPTGRSKKTVESPALLADFKEILGIIAVKSSAASDHRLDDVLSDSFSWLWDSPGAFVSWLQSSHSLFWVAGKPGSGKSTLVQHVATHPSRLLARAGTKTGVITAAYFFNSQAGKLERSIEGLLRSLAHQLLAQSPALYEAMFPSASNTSLFRSTFLPWSNGQLENSIRAAVEHLPNTIFMFLLDGLDEFDGEARVIARFTRSFSSRPPQNAKVCCSSRLYSDFQFELSSVPRLLVESHSSNDIALYIENRLAEIQSMLGSETQTLAEMVASKADGMFLWVRLVMDSLQRGWRRYEGMHALVQRLREMPRDLVDLYQRILDEMDTEDKHEAIRLLVLFSTAVDEFSTPAFFHAWSHTSNKCMFLGNSGCSPPISMTATTDQRQALKRFEGRVYALTRSLVQVSGSADEDQPARFFLLHETVQTFIQQRLLGHRQPGLSDRPTSGNAVLLHACVHYMDYLFTRHPSWTWTLEPRAVECWSELETDYFDLGTVYLNFDDYIVQCQKNRWTAPERYPFEFGFFHYAILHVLHHAVAAESEGDTSLIMSRFAETVFDIWRRLYQIHGARLAKGLPVTFLGLAITEGLTKYAEQEILAMPDVSPAPTPSAAIPLCENRDLKSHYDYSRDPNYLLFEAAKEGNVQLGRLLISKGATVRPTTDELRKRSPGSVRSTGKNRYPLGSIRHWGEAALARAVLYDRADMVTFLLSNGASVAQDLSGAFTMGWVASGGIKRCQILSLDAISLSLKRSRVSVRGYGYTVRNGSVSGSGLFLPPHGHSSSTGKSQTPGPISDDIDMFPYNALSHAISIRSFHAFTALLPFIQAAPELGRSLNAALIQAAGGGDEMHIYVVQLLSHGADATWTKPGFRCTSGPLANRFACYALVAAAANTGDPAIIMSLLQAGADPNFKTPWHKIKYSEYCRLFPSSEAHHRPIDILLQQLSQVSSDSEREERLISSTRLMLRYGARVDHKRWHEYLGHIGDTRRESQLLSKIFPEGGDMLQGLSDESPALPSNAP
ncbi:hypothetical protein V8F20_004942 [Naviculisporaceae sp. PSN 640]